MANDNETTKTAAGADNLEVITEKQLTKQEETLHPRTDEVYEAITESKEQLAGNEKSNDTTSESPQVRMGTYETITENQLKSKSALGDAVIHFGEYPDVITEKQWNDFSRDVAGDVPDDYTEITYCESCKQNVYVLPGLGGDGQMLGCPWCSNKANGLPIQK